MTKIRINILLPVIVVMIVGLGGCIKNDIPYPYTPVNFTSFIVDGQIKPSRIDSTNYEVTVYIAETTNPYAVRVTDYSVSSGGKLLGNPFENPIDLSSALHVTLSLYQDFEWTISSQQDIERYFTIQGQIGDSRIDPAAHTVVVSVPDNYDISSLTVLSAKLGPEGASMSPSLLPGVYDFTSPVNVDVTAFGHTERWTITVNLEKALVITSAVDAWTRVCWVYGQAQEGHDNGVEYRIKGEDGWTRCPASDISHNGGAFKARIIHLQPLTTYEVRTYSDDYFSPVSEVTTGQDIQVPNTTLDHWWLDGKVWNPWTEGEEQYWDTGNKGATTLGQSNSVPTDDTSTGEGKAAMLQTRFVGIAGIGKLAAGNIFVGKYVRTDGTNGVLAFGRPFTDRPTKLTGYYKYTGGLISNTSSEMAALKGQPDTCIVYAALIDCDEPFEIRTNPKNRQLLDPDGSYIVAYGKMQTAESSTEYQRFEFELDYKSTSRVPKYIIITASASKYGDYFTGCNGAVMYVDDLQLQYDY